MVVKRNSDNVVGAPGASSNNLAIEFASAELEEPAHTNHLSTLRGGLDLAIKFGIRDPADTARALARLIDRAWEPSRPANVEPTTSVGEHD